MTLGLEALENGRKPPARFFENVCTFARTFTDRYHHFKEEHVLFVRLAEKHQGAIDAQLDALRHQHERGRALVGEVAGALEGYRKGDEQMTGRIVEAIAAYAALLRRHMHQEDHVFYPMVLEAFSGDELAAVQSAFAEARARSGERTFETSHALVTEMGSLLVHMT